MLWGFQVWFPLLGIRNLDSRWFWWIANQIQLWVQTFYHQSRLPGFTPPGSKHLRGDVVPFRGFYLKLKLTRKIILYFRTSKSLWWCTALIPRANGLTSLYERDRKISLLDRTEQRMEVTMVPLVRQSWACHARTELQFYGQKSG